MKIAGGSGGIIGKKELQELSKVSDRSGAQLVQKLDTINAKLKEQGKVGINLSSGAANMLIREASKNPPMSSFYKYGGDPIFGPGKIGRTLEGMVGSRSTGGYINPISGQQSRSAAVGPTFLKRGMDLMPSGRETVRGVGKQYTYTGATSSTGPYNETNMPLTTPTPGVVPGPWAPTQSTVQPVEDVLPKEEPMTPEDTQAAGNFDSEAFGNWATGYKSARSSRKRSGRNAQGIGSQRVNPTGSFRGGM